MSKLVISLPTRSRPDKLLEVVGKTMKLWQHADTKLIIQVDEDDKPTIDALANPPWLCPPWFTQHPQIAVNVKPREDTIGEKINRAMSEEADVYLIASDDDPVATPGYDVAILEAAARFEDGIGFVHGHMANLSFSYIVAPTRRMVEKLGYIQPGGLFPYWFIDHWTHDIGRITGRISHANVRGDQSKVGATMEFREPGWWATFFDACYLVRRREAHKLINDPDFIETPKRKEMLLMRHIEEEFRSKWINENVRNMAKPYEAAGGVRTDDERYNRVKARAIAILPELLKEMPPDEAMRFSMVLLPPKFIPALTQGWVVPPLAKAA